MMKLKLIITATLQIQNIFKIDQFIQICRLLCQVEQRQQKVQIVFLLRGLIKAQNEFKLKKELALIVKFAINSFDAQLLIKILMQSGQPTPCPKQHASQPKEYAKQGQLKNTPIARPAPFDQEQDSNTRQFTQMPPKFKNKDDQQTNKQPWKIQKKKPQDNVSRTAKASKPERLSFLGRFKDAKQLAPNPKVEAILAKPPLRQRFNELLATHQQLPIGAQHLHLIQKMKMVNRTLDFFRKTRSTKKVFFQELKVNIAVSIQATLNIQHVQQLLFLNQDLYQIGWELGRKNRSEIMIGLPSNFDQTEQNQKVQCVRKRIFQFILLKEKQFIEQQSAKGIELKRMNCSSWVKGFEYQGIKIPLRSLPPNPDNNGAEIRTMDNCQIRKIKNNDISRLFSQLKQKSEVKSFSSADAMDIIFSRAPVSRLKQQLSASVKEKQLHRQKQMQNDKSKPQFDIETLLKICQQLMFCYNSKNISNMFTVTVQKILYDRLKLTQKTIRDSLQFLTKQQANFLSELTTHDGKKVLTINKKMYKQARCHIQKFVPTSNVQQSTSKQLKQQVPL